MTERKKALIWIVIAAVLGGGIPVFSKKSLEQIPPLSFVFLRVLLASAVLVPVFLNKNLRFRKLKGLVGLSLLPAANVIFFSFGVQRTSASISQMLYAAAPLIAAIFSYIVLKEKIGVRKTIGIVTGFSGALLIILLPVVQKGSGLNGSLSGNFIILMAVTSFAFYSVLSKRYQKNYDPLEITMCFVLVTMILQALLLPVDLHNHPGWWRGLSGETIFGVVYVGVMGTAVYYLIYQYAIKIATPLIASMILYLQPILSVVWASVILSEKISSGFIAGSLLALAGIALVTSAGRGRFKKTATMT